MAQTKYGISDIVRALRLPFLSASVLPFIFGSLIEKNGFNLFAFLLGLLVVVMAHLSSNLINDYADSRSGADWRDKKFYKLFGGSKLIQEMVFSEKAYLAGALIGGLNGLLAAVALSLMLKAPAVIPLYLVIILLSWSYSVRPLKLAYRRIGELIIFIMFGPALVMGGYFVQAGIFPTMKGLVLSLPFGFFTTAILFANEVPDYPTDKESGKFNWVSAVGPGKSFVLYIFIMMLGFLSIAAGVYLRYLSPLALLLQYMPCGKGGLT